MNIKKKNPQEAAREDFNDVEVFLNRKDNQFYYLDRYRQPVRLVPESLATDKNNQILEIGGEGDELTLKNGSLNGVPVPDSVIPMEQIAQGFNLEDVSDVPAYSGNADKFFKVNASGNGVEWSLAPSNYEYTEVAISSAQILSLGSTPVELLPQPGANNYYDIDKVVLEYIHGTTSYSLFDYIYFFMDGSLNPAWGAVNSNSLLDTGNRLWIGRGGELEPFESDLIVYGRAASDNSAFKIATWNGTNPTLGDGTLLVKIWYKVRTFGTEL